MLLHEEWLVIARQDLKSIKKNLADDDDTLHAAAYQAQQAAEKSLKAFLAFHNSSIPKTHDLEHIVKCCKNIDFSFVQLEQYAERLSIYSTSTRYPDHRIEVTRPDALLAQKMALFIFEFVTARMP